MRKIAIPLGYLCAWIILACPAILQFGSRFLGDSHSDLWKHIWGYWFMHAFRQGWSYPYHTQLLNFPAGGSLWIIDPLNAVIMDALLHCLTIPAAYNVLLCLALVWGGYCAYLLIAYLVQDNYAAFAGGIIYVFNSYIISYGVASGVVETLQLGWIPFFLLYVLKSSRERAWINPVIAAVALACAFWGSYYYGYFCVILGLVLVLRQFFNPPGLGSHSWGIRLALCAILASALLVPYSMFIYKLSHQGDYMQKAYVQMRESGDLKHYISGYATLKDFVTVGASHARIGTSMDKLYRVFYPGFLPLLVILIAVLRYKAKLSGFWLSVTIVSAVLSLGPFFPLSETLMPAKPVSLLYLLLYYILPGFKLLSNLDRFFVPAMLGLAVCSAYALKALHPRLCIRPALAAMAFCGLYLAETACLSPAALPLASSSSEIPALYTQLAADQKFYGIVDLPFRRDGSELFVGQYFYYQTLHCKGFPYTFNGLDRENLENNHFFKTLWSLEQGNLPDWYSGAEARKGLKLLKAQGFSYLIMHRELYTPDGFKAVRQWLKTQGLKAKIYPGNITVYAL